MTERRYRCTSCGLHHYADEQCPNLVTKTVAATIAALESEVARLRPYYDEAMAARKSPTKNLLHYLLTRDEELALEEYERIRATNEAREVGKP